MISPREQQLLLSMIEDIYEDESHYSFSQAVLSLTDERDLSDEDLFRLAKQRCGRATGMISRVVTKRVYEASVQHNKSVCEVVYGASDEAGRPVNELSDDLLCRMV